MRNLFGVVWLGLRQIHVYRTITRAIVLGGMAVALVLGQSVAVTRGETTSELNASATAGGVTLRLRVPKRSYPRNALVAATVVVQNGSGKRIVVQDLQCRADGPSPAVEVLAHDGKIMFPPALPFPPLGNAQCKEGPPPPLVPGATLRLHYYLILRGPLIRATAYFDVPALQGGLTVGTRTALATPIVRVTLTRADAPGVRVAAHPRVHAVVALPPSLRGRPLLYTDWYTCPRNVLAKLGGQGFEVDSGDVGPITLRSVTGEVLSWGVARSQRIRPRCAHPHEWYLAVGQRGHSVAVAHYSMPLAWAAEEARVQRPRPTSSYLHGPFVAVQLALGLRSVGSDSRLVNRVLHVTLRNRSAIQALVRAINRIPTLEVFPKVAILCTESPGVHTGPAWLSFVRPDDTPGWRETNSRGKVY